MELVGEMPGEVEGVSSRKVWYRCTKCRQASLFDLNAIERERNAALQKVDVKDCTEYSPIKTYSVGESIFHSAWSDVGKVKAKEKTSSGAHAILVSFEKLGERRLIENLKIEEPPPTPVIEQVVPTNPSNTPQSEVI